MLIQPPQGLINPQQLDNIQNELANAKEHLVLPTYEGSGQSIHPKVLYIPNAWNGYKYWMAHTPYPFSNGNLENPSILCSNDGLSWITPPGLINPIVSYSGGSGEHYNDTHLVLRDNDSTLECWFGGSSGPHRMVSKDGVNWLPIEPLYNLSQYSQAVNYDSVNGQYELYYVKGATDSTQIYRQMGVDSTVNRVLDSAMNVDSNSDGVVDNFTSIIDSSHTASFALNNSAQEITISASTVAGYKYTVVYQDIPVTSPAYDRIMVDAMCTVTGNGFRIKVRVDLLDASKNTLTASLISDVFTSSTFVTRNYNLSVTTTGAAYYRVFLEAQTSNIGDTGSLWYKNLKVITRQPIWGTEQLVNSTFPENYHPWHIDVIKTDLGYEAVVNGYRTGDWANNNQVLFYANSQDPINGWNFRQILGPSKNPSAWDNKMIYRSTLVKNNGLYKLWYSAFSVNTYIHIGYAEGMDIDSLVGYRTTPNHVIYNTTISVPLASLQAGITLIGGIEGRKIRVIKYYVQATGDFSVGGGTGIVLQDDSTTPIVVTTILKAVLTSGAKVCSDNVVSNVTDGIGFMTDLGSGKDLVIKADSGLSNGTSVMVSIDYVLR